MAPAVGAWVLTLSLATCWFWPGAEAACYYPSGRLSPNDTPCRDDTPHATCCGQGYACLSNGMCQATGEELIQSGASEYVRGACTDETWRSSSCPLFCIEEDVDFLDGGNGVAKCENTSQDLYYCINTLSAEEASCEENRKLLFFAGTPSAITTIGVTPTSTTSSSTSTTAKSSSTTSDSDSATSQTSSTSTAPGQNESGSTSETPTPDDDTSSGSTNIGAIVGGVVGGVVVVILAALGGWLLARKRWATRANGPSGSQNGNGNSYGNNNDHSYEHSYGNATSVIAPSGYQPPGEQKLAYTEPHVYRDEAYQQPHVAHVPPAGWGPETPNGPYELGLHEAPPPARGQAMELPVDRFPELPAGHK